MQEIKDRVEQRRKKISKIRRRRRLRLFTLFLIALFIILAGVILFNSSFFRLKQIKVTGNRHFTKKDIISLAQIPPETSLFRLPTTEIRERVLKNPRIKEVQVIRHFPNVLQIAVVERKPIAIIDLEDFYALIDDEFFVIEQRASVEGLNLPLIRKLKLSQFPVGKIVRSKSLSNAIKCLTSLSPALKTSVKIVFAPSVDKLTLFTDEGVEILYGKAENILKKNYVLKKILSEDGKKINFIDIRVVSNPVVKRLRGPD